MSDADAPVPQEAAQSEPVSSVAMDTAAPVWERGRSRAAEIVGLVAALGGLLGVVIVHLGPALVGLKTFAAMDRLASVSPWWDGGARADVLNAFLGDSIDSLLPAYIQIYARLAQGDWALWSSLGGAGTELLATTNSPTLTLSTAWFLLLPTWYATGFVKLVEIVLATGGMYLWMRRIGLGRAAGVLAGVFYVGSGFVVGWATWSAQSSVAAMIPALFWAVECYLARKTARSAIPLAAVVALLLLGGFPAVAGHALYAGGGYFVIRLIAERAAHPGWSGWKLFAGGVGAVLLGVALSAVQLVPLALGLSETDLSARSGQFYSQQPVESFLSMFFPGSMYTLKYPIETNPIEAYAFLGMGAVFLALAAVITPRLRGQARGVVPYLAGAAVLAGALVWHQGWWTDWMANLPIFTGNNSGRLRDIVCLSGAALAGIGAERVFRAARPVRVRLIALVVVMLIVFGAETLVIRRTTTGLPTETLLWDVVPGLGIIAAAGVAIVLARHRAIPAAAFGVVAVLAALQMGVSVSNYWPLNDVDEFYPRTALIKSVGDAVGSDRVLTSGGFMGSTASVYGIRSATAHSFQPTEWRQYLEALDLGAFQPGQSPTNPTLSWPGTETAPQTRLLDRLGAAAWVTSFNQSVPGYRAALDGAGWSAPTGAAGDVTLSAGIPAEVPLNATGVRAVTVSVTAVVPHTPEGFTITAELVDGAGAVVATGVAERTSLQPQELTIAMAAESAVGDLTLRLRSTIDLVLAADAQGRPNVAVTVPTDDGLTLAYADASGTLWLRESALARIRWAGDAVVETGAERRLALLASDGLADDTVVLAEDGPQGGGGGASIEVTEDSGDDISVTVNAETAGYLVVADWMQRGWSVSVDGDEAQIVSADHAFSAVYVTEGEHEIVFTYSGSGVAPGVAISSAALAVIAAIFVVSWTAARRRRAAG